MREAAIALPPRCLALDLIMKHRSDNKTVPPAEGSLTTYRDMALGNCEQRYTLLFENNMAAVYLTMIDGRVIDCNQAYAELLGCKSRQEVLRLSAWDFYYTEQERRAFLERLVDAGSLRQHEKLLRRRNGTPLWVLENVTLLDGEFLLGTLLDITDRKLSRDTLEQSEERLRLLIESTHDVILMQDLTGRYIYANQSPAYGITPQEVIGKTPHDLFEPETAERTMQRLAQVIATRQPLTAEDSTVWRGQRMWFHVVFHPVIDRDGMLMAVSTFARNVTETRLAEEALHVTEQRLQAQKLRMRIAEDLHDEMGSTLSSISIFSELVRQRVQGMSPELLPLVNRISRNVETVLRSLDDIVWAVDPGHDTLADLVRRMQDQTAELLSPLHIQHTFSAGDFPNGQPIPVGKRKDVYLIFKEGLNNAVRHSGCTALEIGVSFADGTLTLEIADNGRGFDPSVPSTGNGLANMTRRARSLGSDLVVDSRPGQGTRVTLSARIT